MAFDPTIADKICERIATGEPLRAICRDEGMPSKSQVYNWMDKSHADFVPEFAGRFARAREEGYDEIAQSAMDIADDDSRDWEPVRDADGQIIGVKVDGEHVQRSKLRIETRLKLLAKWDPKRYGEKLALGGADDLPPIKTLPDEQLLAKIAALQAKVSRGDTDLSSGVEKPGV